MAIGTLGGILGILTGIIGAILLGRFVLSAFGGSGASALNPVFLPIELIEVFILAIILSIIAGLYPAWRASKLSPINALRKE
jgi:putative ABC transport system permease protein